MRPLPFGILRSADWSQTGPPGDGQHFCRTPVLRPIRRDKTHAATPTTMSEIPAAMYGMRTQMEPEREYL
jgi:hypothetical protein